jgi:hypothetical protein
LAKKTQSEISALLSDFVTGYRNWINAEELKSLSAVGVDQAVVRNLASKAKHLQSRIEADPKSARLKSVLTASLPSVLLPYIVVACTVKQHWHPLFVVVECGHSLFNLFAITDEKLRVNERIEVSW